ncbi:MAG: hypothetical protein WD030_07190, partial [Pirellulales bacterium]
MSTENFSSMVDLRKPGDGIADLKHFGTALAGVRPFGLLHRAADPALISGPIVERFARQQDLFVRYGSTPDQPFSPSVYWTFLNEDSGAVGIRLIASIQTDLLDTHPDLIMRTVCPADDVRRLTSESAANWRPIESDMQLHEANTPHCVLVRLPATRVSYAEMIHPADFRGTSIQFAHARHAATIRLQSLLLTRWMEKGVILRARAQGVFLPRENDEQLAFAAYQR